MNAKLKWCAYVVLTALAIWLAWEVRANYAIVTQVAAARATNAGPDLTAVPDPGNTNQAPAAPLQTNVADLSTNNPAATNDAAGSNVAPQSAAPAAPPTNARPTKAPPTNAPVARAAASSAPAPEARQGKLVGYLAAFVIAMIGLGLLVAYDVTHFMGARAVALLFSDRGEVTNNPEYDHAEATWADGKPLEAVQMMREYLKKNPREQYVALRIAEIYEKDLHNDVAASLEYEEVLKKRLPAERWGWAAIHLCNIYSRMGRQERMAALLQRIARDYPKTGAAKKARHALGLPEPEEEAVPVEEPEEILKDERGEPVIVFDLDEAIAATEEEAASPPPQPAPPPPPPEVPSKPSLPPGFRPK
jgi:TolA-binding protein